MTGHPNTLAAAVSGGFGTLAVYLLNKYAGTHLNTVDGAGIATGAAAAVLFVGRRGIRGTFSAIWHGSDPRPAPAAPTTVAPRSRATRKP